MNSAPKHACRGFGCGVLIEAGQGNYCPRHARPKVERVQYDRMRGTSHQRGYDARWQKARLGHLALEPFCRKCVPGPVLATVVDHIIPHRGNMELFWDNDNWQSLCKSCHDTKTATEDGGFRGAQSVARETHE